MEKIASNRDESQKQEGERRKFVRLMYFVCRGIGGICSPNYQEGSTPRASEVGVRASEKDGAYSAGQAGAAVSPHPHSLARHT
jgi:hypothetical protein